MDDSRIKSAAALLSAFFDEEKLKRGGRYAEFFSTWTYLVGERAAAHSWVAEVDGSTVIVEAEHPGWVQLLQLRQSTILEGLSRRFPELGLRAIVFRLGRERAGGNISGETRPEIERKRAEREMLSEADHGEERADGSFETAAHNPAVFDLSSVEDEALRSSLASLRESYREKRKDLRAAHGQEKPLGH